MYLDALEWGPGCPYRLGDLPADFHTTEIINKMRHARKWTEIVEKGQFPNFMKKQNAIITDIETKDWIFREAEIDELQDIRLALLNKLKAEQQQKRNSRISSKLAKLWADKKDAMEQKIDKIRRTRDRELRKLSSRGRGRRAVDSEHAPLARLGYRASRRHAEIVYDPSLLVHEDHRKLAEPPAWLEQCGQNLTKTCSGHHLPRDVTQLCERETKWSEQFLANLHSDLKKARLGAAKVTAGPLRVLRPRQLPTIARPPTPEVEGVEDNDESVHQAALVLQRVIRGRAVQVLMFEGRTRAGELTEELKTTHGLQREDRERIAREESKARDYQALRSETEQKEQAISSLVQELCGGAVSAALDFLEKELRRLREERRQHAFILIAQARLGAAKVTAGPLRVLRPRQLPTIARPPTPEVEGVEDNDESVHQAALVLQRVIRGRAVQVLCVCVCVITELRKLSSRGRGRRAVDSEHAPLARLGYRASRRHAEIVYDPSLLVHEDHRKLAEPPAWLEQCGQNLTKTCSGHHLPRDVTQLCERETKWSEQFLANLHSDLKKARLGAAKVTAGPLRVLRPRQLPTIARPPTPEVEGVEDNDESVHQAALVLQRVIRGRAVQVLMFEGRTRAGELTEELKTTHGLQREDRERIAREESKARDYQALRSETEQKEQAISSLVQELCGGAVSAALDFLEKELRRLREERRQHAFILIALREKTMREAAEAGRRQKEEHRRREHDEIFKRVLGVTQETVDAYLQDVLLEGVALAAEEDAVRNVLSSADRMDKELAASGSISTAEQNELVAELVQQFLLPEAHKTASRHKITTIQKGRLEAARASIMGVLIDAEDVEATCPRCGRPLDDQYKCSVCKPTATTARDDPRWKHTKRREVKEKMLSERYPASHEIRCMLNALVYDAVETSRSERRERESITRFIARRLREDTEINIDAIEMVNEAIARSTGEVVVTKRPDYHHYMTRICEDALARTLPYATPPCPKELPSEIRRRAEEAAALEDPTCRCDEDKSKVKFGISVMDAKEKSELLPSELRLLEELRRCKCDTNPSPSPITVSSSSDGSSSSDFTDAVTEEEGNENQ
nr:uncharacterized protein LOC116776753 [Danaus plexippus plexippus]